jgi:serine/threonine-protein kinase
MGQVWLAEHKGLDIQVAVKFMRRDVADDPVSAARFEQEAKLAARIKSPHVVEVFDYDVTASGIPFIVMESLSGRDLETALQNGRTLSIADTARVLVQTCKALAKAHAVGVIHRDIKAENVFIVQEDGVPIIKLLDFGVARDAFPKSGISLSGTTVGTPVYMSPEQLFHPKDIDLRTDLWATAVLVYRCLTGTFPFEGESFPSVCLSVSQGKFAPPSVLNSGLPAELDTWFQKAFHKSLDARFASASEMAEAFLSELRSADLLPGWAEPESLEVALSRRAPASPSAGSSRRRERGRKGGRARMFKVGTALAAALMVGVAVAPVQLPEAQPLREAMTAVAAQAAEQGRAWAINEGWMPAPVALVDEAPVAEGDAFEIRFLSASSAPARAEREVARVDVASTRDRRSANLAFEPAGHEPLVAAAVTPPPSAATSEPSSASSTESPATAPASSDLATIRFGL